MGSILRPRHQLSHRCHAEEYADSVELRHDWLMRSITPSESPSEWRALLRPAMGLEVDGPDILVAESDLLDLGECPGLGKGELDGS